jgi:small subunit ribosomal protein S1
MSHTRKISHANEMLKRGDTITCQVISVDEDRKRIALGLKQLSDDPWETTIPAKYQPGALVKGKVTKITNFGVFVELEDDLEGLLHISELADHKVENPEDIVQVGQELEVRILRVDTDDRKIGLSRKLDVEPDELEEGGAAAEAGGPGKPSAPKELKGGTGGESGPLFSFGGGEASEEPAPEEMVPEEAASEEMESEETEEKPAE